MSKVPLDQGWQGRRRFGPFWLEEAPIYLLVAALFLLSMFGLYLFLALR